MTTNGQSEAELRHRAAAKSVDGQAPIDTAEPSSEFKPPPEPTEWQIIERFWHLLKTSGASYKLPLLFDGIAVALSLVLPAVLYDPIRQALQTLCPPFELPPPLRKRANHMTTSLLFSNQIMTGFKPSIPECWGHRGASAVFPENTIASFERAIRDGAEGLESDVHITSDDVVIMFHDPSLDRTTDGTGLIHNQPWSDGIEKARTKAKPSQQIPTFRQVCDLLMRPENQHVKLNIDIKPENNPERLFRLMKATVESYDDFATVLSPRLILGLWHPIFLRPALEHVPSLRRVHIGGSPLIARTYFWRHCDGFSMWFPSLVSTEGQNFLQQAQREGKDVFVWTVNRRDEMIEATRWGVKAILTDKTDLLRDVRRSMSSDYATTRSHQVGIFFRWATWRYYQLPQLLIQSIWLSEIEKRAGISCKRAYKRDQLATFDIPASALAGVAASVPSSSVAHSPATTATLNEPDVPPISVGAAKLDPHTPAAAPVTPVVAAKA